MTILRAPVAWLTALAAIPGGYQFVPTGPPSGVGASGSLGANVPNPLSLSAASQIIAGVPKTSDFWIVIAPNTVQQLSAGNFASMPTEPLQLSRECCCDFKAGWIAVFTALGFTPFTPVTSGALPSLGC